MICISGASAFKLSSKRTWSFPLPVQPWQMASAPSLMAISARPLAMQGRAWLVPSPGVWVLAPVFFGAALFFGSLNGLMVAWLMQPNAGGVASNENLPHNSQP